MGAYIYRLRGTKAYEIIEIEGKQEKVYDYVYWYKPYYCGMFEKEPSWMKPVHMLAARLEKAFAKLEPVKWVRHVDSKGVKDNEVMEWPSRGICISDYNERYQTARRISIDSIQKV
jgi:hypothetical protein